MRQILRTVWLVLAVGGASVFATEADLVYEFDRSTLADMGWSEFPGGFIRAEAGKVTAGVDLGTLFTSSKDRLGVQMTAGAGQVALIYLTEPVRTEGHPLLIRAVVRAGGPSATVALAALKGNLVTGEDLDFSIATHIPATAANFVEKECRLCLLYEPDSGDLVTPLFQIAGQTESTEVYVDRVEILRVDPVVFGSTSPGQSSPTPEPPTPTRTFTPTSTPTSTSTPIPTPTPGGDTITVELPELAGSSRQLELVRIPAGTFRMGSPSDEPDRLPGAWPPHNVTLTKDFYIGKYEVTQAQFYAVTGENPSENVVYDHVVAMKGNHPVDNCLWFDCVRFCNRLSEMKGRTPVYDESSWTANWSANGYRLPTEAEWEYACRAGTTTQFYWGADYSQVNGYEWVHSNSSIESKEVGVKLPNPWGLYDVTGNVREWCWDWWQEPYDRGDQVDPTGPDSGSHRVLRGDYYGGSGGSPAYRTPQPPDLPTSPACFGFRVVLSCGGPEIPTPTSIPTRISTPTRTFTPTSTPTSPSTPTPTPSPGREAITVELPTLPVGAKPLELVRIPAGAFVMGAPNNEQDGNYEERPQHRVTISRDFYLGKCEVTQAQWQAMMGVNPVEDYGFGLDYGPNYPVYYVTWHDCVRFCNAVSRAQGLTPVYDESDWTANWNANGYRLPAEAEWEYACRAGTTTRFYWGDDPGHTQIKDYAWYSGNSTPYMPREVGLKSPNAWGLYDMSGNVWEWCWDWYGPYSAGELVDPIGPQSGAYRVFRGSWGGEAMFRRSAYRGWYDPQNRTSTGGVRLARRCD